MPALKYKSYLGEWVTLPLALIPEVSGSVSWNDVLDKPLAFTPSAHSHVKADITDFPTSMPASDVSAWAKAASKPAYTYSEVGAAAASHGNHVPTPQTANNAVYLRNDNSWQTISPGDIATDAVFGLKAYRVGAIYMSVVSTSPATLFGGTWAALGGRMLIGVDGTYTAGATGGSATHGHTQSAHTHTGPSHTHTGPAHSHTTPSVALTVAQMPIHNHSTTKANLAGSYSDGYIAAGSYTANGTYVTGNSGSSAAHGHGDTGSAGTGNTGSAGTGNTGSATPAIADSNGMPPYLAVYMWKRTA